MSAKAEPKPRLGMVAVAGPGLLLAATGVGGGDLATGSIVGSLLGTAVLWAVVVGAFLKYVVTEGLARWQLATGETFLEGVVHRLGPAVIVVFLPFLLLWSFFVGSAQMSACGIALHAIFPFFETPERGKIVFGMASSLVGIGLVLKGGYRLFEQVMRVCIGIMFVTVVLTAVMLWPGTGEVLAGLFVPRIPDAGGTGLIWTIALIGGIGGTLTVLSYGYWLREEGRSNPEDLWICRIDLGAGYTMTAVFGIGMIIVGSTIEVSGQGTTLLVTLSDRLGELIGPVGKWLFLLGAWGAVFSSLLGVWQSVPYLFADCWGLLRQRAHHAELEPIAVDTRALPYRIYLAVLGIVPMIGLFWGFRDVQRLYTVTGALFFPFLALALLIMTGRAAWIGAAFKTRPAGLVTLIAILAFFCWVGLLEAMGRI
ncbi:MAG TPA: Nramp family divalent metal transporter [Gammaproteobacteria bacterium]|jgi:Mn2+/Fe2+ NRAMP family transporter